MSDDEVSASAFHWLDEEAGYSMVYKILKKWCVCKICKSSIY